MKEPSHSSIEPVSDKLLRLLFKSNSADTMSKAELEAAAPRIKAYNTRLWLIGGSIGTVGTAGAFMLLTQVYTNWAGPVVDPIVNERPYWGWIMPCALAVFSVIGAAECMYCAKINPQFGELLHRYLSTQNKWNARKTAWFGTLLGMLMAIVLSLALVLSGKVIDKNGIQYASGLILARKTYSDVAKIGYYDALNAPIGKRNIDNIAITFKDKDRLIFLAEKRYTPNQLEDIASFVGEQAGLQIERGPIRPGDD